jgi:tripartite-type tricarboxylate transporter receptor subunit TctC
LGTLAGGAEAQDDYPAQPIAVAACYGAGGGVDRALRIIERVAQPHLGQPILVEYVLGGSGSVAMQHVQNAEPDGYKLTMCDNGGAIIAPIAQGLDFGPDSVTPIAQILFQPWILTAREGSPYSSLQDVIDAANDGGDPVAVEISDMGTSDHFGVLLFASAAGLDLTSFKWNPHGGGGEKMRAIMAGEGDLINDDAGEIEQHVRAGTLRPLAVAGVERHPSFHDVPTFRELGFDVIAGQQIALFGPADMPEDRVARLREALAAMKEDPTLIAAYEAALQDPETLVIDEFADQWQQDWEKAPGILRAILQ